MGHHLDGKSSIVPLIDRLNKYPIGLPDTDKLRRILEILFSEEEAFVASRFPLTEATLQELIRATGWEAERLEAKLEEMANKGLVMDNTYGGKTYYLLMPGLIGFFEFSFMKQRQDLPVAELAQLMDEYMFGGDEKEMGREFFGSKTPLTRSLVYEDHVPVSSQVETYESARDLNLTHITDNIRNKPSFICNCCSCCCELLGGVIQGGFPMGVAKTNYTLQIDSETCVGCGLCKKACNVTALELIDVENGSKKRQMRVVSDNCLGCGACISSCPTNSASLIPAQRSEIPEKKKDLFKQILKEKKRLTPFVVSVIKKKIRRTIGMG
jgi:ferredoxin